MNLTVHNIVQTTARTCFLFFFFFGYTLPVFASCSNALPAKGNSTINNIACTISTIDGVDDATHEQSLANTGTLTITGGASITINNTGRLVLGALNLIAGSIAIETGGTITTGSPLYITDTDADGWPANTTLYLATASGRRRLGLMRSLTTVDCNDANDYRVDNLCCVATTRYRDSDGDGYGNPAISQLLCPTSGWVTNNTDCYDGNSNAYPGSSTCSTVHRGDGSFDYNCSLSATNCGLTYYSLRNAQSCDFKCGKNNATCCAVGTVALINTPVACGVAGYLRVGTSYNHGNCGSPCTQSTGYSYGASGTQSCQ